MADGRRFCSEELKTHHPLFFSSSPTPTSTSPHSSMGRKAVRYVVVDAFTSTAFKGNPAAVCWLEDSDYDDDWMRAVAREFNLSQTVFLSRTASHHGHFNLRWFTPVQEVKLCGHGTLAASHFLLTSGLTKCNVIEFNTKSGRLVAKKIMAESQLGNFESSNGGEKFSIELDFPVIPIVDCDVSETPSIPESLNGASVINTTKTAAGDLIVELASGLEVSDVQPNFYEIQQCAGRGLIITGAAPIDSGFDFYSRFFCPKLGVNEDPVCGSAHCSLAPYWSKKLGKSNLVAYMASPRGGRLDLQLEEVVQRVRIQGEAIIVMEGTLMV